MTTEKSLRVVDAGDLRKYRTELPNLIDDLELSVYAVRLYLHLKRVAGGGVQGVCTQGTRTLADHCRMSIGKVSQAKKELADKKLIEIERRGKDESDVITIVDIWRDNFERYAPADTCSPHEHPVHDMNTPVHIVNDPVHHMNERRNSLKKEPIKKEQGEAAPAAHVLTPQQEMFEAVCQACGIDPKTLGNRRGKIAVTCKALVDGGYGPPEIARFMTEIWAKDWRWLKNQSFPTPSQLQEEIGKIRSIVPQVLASNGMSKEQRIAANAVNAGQRVRERMEARRVQR